MCKNFEAVKALQEYVKIKRPGYAFMIEAPWGAGKTHLVMREFESQLQEGEARYVSVNGVSDRGAFRRALLASTSASKLTDAAGKLGDTLGKIAKTGNVGSLVRDFVEDRMIDNLPDILIFDDIERCEMSAGELLGLINEFVEHKKKNVVLCAFIEREDVNEEQSSRKSFLSRKEKVVGRTVRITADAQAALAEFIETMPTGYGKQWLQSNDTLILEEFTAAEHNNLRVLRQCLYDCGRVIDVLEEELRQSTDAMIRFVRTFLVLSMALATSEISFDQLSDRGNHKLLLEPKEDEIPLPLFNCLGRHPQAEIFAGGASSILPIELGMSLIGIGYEAPEKINEILRATGQFQGEQEIPLWRHFVKWRHLTEDDLKMVYAEAKSYVFESEEISPGPYLHIAQNLISIAESGLGKASEMSAKIVDRIKHLEKTNKIPAAAYGINFGWDISGGTYTFGGYGFTPDEFTRSVIEAMKDAQIAAFKVTLPNEAKRLLKLLGDDLEAFEREFSWDTRSEGYYNAAILHEIYADMFATAVFDHITSGKFEHIGEQLTALAERLGSNGDTDELAWAIDVKTELISLAEKAGPLEKARMDWFLKFYWKFPLGDETDA